MSKLCLFQEHKASSIFKFSIQYINKLKKKNHIIILIDREKSFGKIQCSFMMKFLRKLRTEGNFLDLVKNSYKKL
jgi:hypothetical protein